MQGWGEDRLVTLQLIAHLRDIRNGKGETACSLDAYVWLAKHHPRTLLVNLPEMVKVGTVFHTKSVTLTPSNVYIVYGCQRTCMCSS